MERDMRSNSNSIESIRKLYQEGIIDPFRTFMESKEESREAKWTFGKSQYRVLRENNPTPRWNIVSPHNFFGIEGVAETKRNGKRLFLKANAGRFRLESPPLEFKNMIDISDILGRNPEEQFTELDEFYSMNNREFFQKFGVEERGESVYSVANCLLLDSLLKEKYSELEEVWCHNSNGEHTIDIKLNDGTIISAYDEGHKQKKGRIEIKKGKESANVVFGAVSPATFCELIKLEDIDVKDIIYSGDEQLAESLRKAMAEQFKSQRQQVAQTDEIFPYQEALELFEQSYFPEGIKSAKDWNRDFVLRTFLKNFEDANNSKSPSTIIGRNAFSPYIGIENDKNGKERYKLSLYKGKFYGLGYNADAPLCDNEIDITDMSKDEIVALVRSMLLMTNEDVIEQFKPHLDDRLIVALIIDDEIQRSFESDGTKDIQSSYEGSFQGNCIEYYTADGKTIHIGNYHKEDDDLNNNKLSVLFDNGDQISIRIENEYNYSRNRSISSIKIEDIHESSSTENKLQQSIIGKLKDRFINRDSQVEHVISPEGISSLHTAEEIGEGIGDLTQGEVVDTLNAITAIREPQKDPYTLE